VYRPVLPQHIFAKPEDRIEVRGRKVIIKDMR